MTPPHALNALTRHRLGQNGNGSTRAFEDNSMRPDKGEGILRGHDHCSPLQRSNPVQVDDRPLILHVARVQRRGRHEQEDVSLLLGNRPVFDATRHDQEFTLLQPDVPISELHPKPALDDQEEFVLLSWWCQTNDPWNLTSFTIWPFNSPTIFGFHCSLNCASFSLRFTLSMLGSVFWCVSFTVPMRIE
jgi:hypothetical protein